MSHHTGFISFARGFCRRYYQGTCRARAPFEQAWDVRSPGTAPRDATRGFLEQ